MEEGLGGYGGTVADGALAPWSPHNVLETVDFNKLGRINYRGLGYTKGVLEATLYPIGWGKNTTANATTYNTHHFVRET